MHKPPAASHFERFIENRRRLGELVIQPRMGWGDPALMRRGLYGLRTVGPNVIGTITLDSYTRVGDYQSPARCLAAGHSLNGYPIMTHSVATTRSVLENLHDETFPIQVRHGTSLPQEIFHRIVELNLHATEGGPVSYCLPYGRVPLRFAIRAWEEATRILADGSPDGHIESFGGCLMGQLCPPSMLIAVSLLECLFFAENGIRSVSLSYTQGTSPIQDRAGLRVLRELAQQYLAHCNWHVVLYTYMGLFPRTPNGAMGLILDSARLARQAQCERLIVKTRAESLRIPTLEDNLHALRMVDGLPGDIESVQRVDEELACAEEVREEAKILINAVLNIDCTVSRSLLAAFRIGLLDVPYCFHPDNKGSTCSFIDRRGHICWLSTGKLPLQKRPRTTVRSLSSAEFLEQLSYVARLYDEGRAHQNSGVYSQPASQMSHYQDLPIKSRTLRSIDGSN